MDDEIRIEPAAVLPIQLFDSYGRGARLYPEKRLQLAVLADAVMTHLNSAGLSEPTSAATEVAEWFRSDDATDPFSFVAICGSLGLDAAYMRRGLDAPRPQVRGRTNARHSFRHESGRRVRVIAPRTRRVA